MDRATKWGNPFVVGRSGGAYTAKVKDRRHAYLLFKGIAADNEKLVADAQAELRGRNLACWCPKDDPYEDCCHAAVLLEIANSGATPPHGNTDMKQKDCKHETLKFGSGDYYLFCQGCSAQWVMNRTDGGPDSPFAGGSNIGVGCTLSGQIRASLPTGPAHE